jgi:hypothetical protein
VEANLSAPNLPGAACSRNCRGAGSGRVHAAVRVLHGGASDSDPDRRAPQCSTGAGDFTARAGIHVRQDYRARAGGARIGVRAVRSARTDRRRLLMASTYPADAAGNRH